MAVLSYESSSSSKTSHTYIPMPAETISVSKEESDDDADVKPSWHSLFLFTSRTHGGSIAIALFSTLLSSLLKPASAILYGKIFSDLTKYGAGTANRHDTLHGISRWCIALVALGAVAWMVEGTFLLSWMAFGELQAKSARERLFVGMLNKEMGWYDLQEDGIESLLIRIQTQIRELQLAVSQPIGYLVYEVFGSIAALGLAFFYSWKLTLVVISTFPAAGIILWLVSRRLGPAIEEQKRELTRASKYANTAITAINTVKAYNGQDQEVWQYYDTIRRVASAYLIQARCNALQFGIIKFVVVGLFVQGFWYGLTLVKEGLDPGHILTTFYACLAAMQAIETVLPQWLVLKKGMSAGQTLKLILTHMEHGREVTKMVGSMRPESCEGDIEIKGVDFAYPLNLEQKVLSNADFFFPAGEMTFVVGTSGSGKSTLGNLLMKYYEPLRGEILIDGNSLQVLDSDWLRNNVTLVQQESILFNETILQNIEFGRNEKVDRSAVIQATRTADLEQTLLDLPNGLNTLVGSSGKSLSGGQSQRIALARARLRDAPIVILDEATSALDPTSREKVMLEIRKWRKGKTTIIITHDVTQINDDEYVYVLERGVVVQEGYRNRLAEKSKGTFASFMPAQTLDLAVDSDTRSYSEPASPELATPGGFFDERVPMKEGHLSKFFGIEQVIAGGLSGGLGAPGGHKSLALGGGASQANALRAEEIWSTPAPQLEDGVFQPFLSAKSDRESSRLSMGLSNSISTPKDPHKVFLPDSPPVPASHTPMLQIPASTAAKSYLKRPPLDITVPYKAPIAPIELSDLQIQPSPAPKPLIQKKPATIRRILGTIWPTLRWQERSILCLGFLASFIVAAATPAFAYVFANLLQVYYVTENRTAVALKWALALLAVATIDGVATFTAHYALEYAGQAWVNTLRVEALKRILAQPRSWFDKDRNSPNRLNECLDRNAEEMRNLIGRFAGLIFTTFFMLTISVVWSFIITWKLTLVALACAPVVYVTTRMFNWVSAKWEDKTNAGSAATSSIFTSTFSTIRVVRALTLESYFTRKHTSSALSTYQTGLQRASYTGLLFGLSDALSYLITALVFYYGAVLITNNEEPVTSILEVANLLLFGISNAISMLNLVPQINTSRTTATHMLYLANLPLHPSHENTGTKRLASPFPVEFKSCNFTYHFRPTHRALNSVSLKLQPGSCTAIVGPSGSGKSTIASILLGLYPPDAGLPSQLTFAHTPISDCNIASLRQFIAFVPQAPMLFPSSILSNITYGLPEGSPFANLEAATHAAQEAGIHDFISSLAHSYATLIGEGGIGLSGGQAQRIAIARALVRRPRILVMDEATSALDAVSAEAVRETVRRLIERGRESKEGGTAVLLISHGVEMMRVAEEVLVVEDGVVVERGGFEELRRAGGALSRLVGREGKEDVMERVVRRLEGRNKETWKTESM